MTTITRDGGQDDHYLDDMERQAQQLAQTGHQLIRAVGAQPHPVAQQQYSTQQPQTQQQQSTQLQQNPDVATVDSSDDLAIVLTQPRPGVVKVRDYLQRQIATAACFLLVASLIKKLPLVWEHRQIYVAVALFIATLILNATGAKQGQEAGDRLYGAAEMGEHNRFHKHLQILLLHRESRYLILLEVAIGMLLADAFATTFLK